MPMYWNNLFVVLSLFRGCYLLLFDHLASQMEDYNLSLLAKVTGESEIIKNEG